MTTPTAPIIDKQAIRSAVSRGSGRVQKAFTDAEVYEAAERLHNELGKYLQKPVKMVK